jgi:molybdenum cofactor cytidylyltransferase
MTEQSRSFAAIIAAAGSSSRMGRPKALLPIEDQSFVVHAASEMLTAGAGLVVVTLPEGADGDRVRQALAIHFENESRVLCRANDWMDRGYSGSLQSGLQHCANVDICLMMPVDAPFFTAEMVRRLVTKIDADHVAAVPRVGENWGHPIALSMGLRVEMDAMHEQGGPRGLLESLGTRLAFLEWPDPRVTWNLNTPAAFQKAFPPGIARDQRPR